MTIKNLNVADQNTFQCYSIIKLFFSGDIYLKYKLKAKKQHISSHTTINEQIDRHLYVENDSPNVSYRVAVLCKAFRIQYLIVS